MAGKTSVQHLLEVQGERRHTMSNTPSEELRLLLQEARSALWQPANVELCERIDDALARWGTPQPVAREPLSDAQIKELIEDGVFLGNCKEIVRAIEHAHGITQRGGSNGL